MEIAIAAVLLGTAIWVLVRNLRGKGKGDCSCGSCSAKCPKYEAGCNGISFIKK